MTLLRACQTIADIARSAAMTACDVHVTASGLAEVAKLIAKVVSC